MKYIMGFLLALNMTTVLASGWHCRNNEVEVFCYHGKCKSSDEFTPVDVHFSTTGNISIAMYTGVWEGKTTLINEDNYLIAIGKQLVFSTPTGMKTDFIITLDKKDKIALLKGYGFAMPMTCKMEEKEE